MYMQPVLLVSVEDKLKYIQEQEQEIPLTQNHDQRQINALAGENRAGRTAEEIAVSFLNQMIHSVGRPLELSNLIDKYHALSVAVRDRLIGGLRRR